MNRVPFDLWTWIGICQVCRPVEHYSNRHIISKYYYKFLLMFVLCRSALESKARLYEQMSRSGTVSGIKKNLIFSLFHYSSVDLISVVENVYSPCAVNASLNQLPLTLYLYIGKLIWRYLFCTVLWSHLCSATVWNHTLAVIRILQHIWGTKWSSECCRKFGS